MLGIRVVEASSLDSSLARPVAAPHESDDIWLRDLDGALAVVFDLSGQQAQPEAFCPEHFPSDDEDTAAPASAPNDMAGLLVRLTHWQDRESGSPKWMADGRQWLGVLGNPARRIDTVLLVAERQMVEAQFHLVVLLQAVPEGGGQAWLEAFLADPGAALTMDIAMTYGALT